jgi:hypothetical protein
MEEVNLLENNAIFHKKEEPLEEVNLLEGIAIFHKEEEPLKEVNLSDSLTVFDDSSIHHVLDESLEDEIFDFSLERINYVDLVGIENFLSNFLIII